MTLLTNNARRRLLLAALVLAAGGLLSACTFSAGGGLAAAVIAALVGGGLLLTATTQSGCSGLGPCLSPLPVARPPDAGAKKVDQNPPKPRPGPCLSIYIPPKQDAGAGPIATPDVGLKPCLSVAPPPGATGSRPAPGTDEAPQTTRTEAVDRVRTRLPAELAARLEK